MFYTFGEVSQAICLSHKGLQSNKMSVLDDYHDEIAQLRIDKNMSPNNIADYLKASYGNQRGFSETSVKRFCVDNEIRVKVQLSDEHLEEAIEEAIPEVM